MPRKRKPENRGLPARWQFTHGAYYFFVPAGLEAQWDGKRRFRLGATLPEAYRTWASRVDRPEAIRTIADALDRYLQEVVPSKAQTTQTGNALAVRQLRAVFGGMPLTAIRPRHVYQYVDKRSQKRTTEAGRTTGGRTVAHREVEVLSHAFTKAVEWGLLDRHPFKGEVRLTGEKSRDRYVEDWEVVACLSLDSRRKRGSVLAIQAYMRIKLMTGLARGDLLRLTVADLRDDGIHVQRHKTANTTGRRTIYSWTPELRQAVEDAKAARPVLSPFLFCNRAGRGYVDEATGEAHGWDSMWQRFMDRVLRETEVSQRFTEHDLRAKCASDADSLERARALLQHATSATTQRHYRRRPERVEPLKGVG